MNRFIFPKAAGFQFNSILLGLQIILNVSNNIKN